MDLWIKVEDDQNEDSIFRVNALDVTRTRDDSEGFWIFSDEQYFRVEGTHPKHDVSSRVAAMRDACGKLGIDQPSD